MRRLFVLNNSGMRGELVRYDPSTGTFTMVLPGASATYVDFAKKARGWLPMSMRGTTHYVMNRADGSDARQLTSAGVGVEL